MRNHRLRPVKLESARARATHPLTGPSHHVHLVPAARQTRRNFFYVHRATGRARHHLIGCDVKELHEEESTARSNKKNGPVRMRPKNATSSFIKVVATASGP